MLARYLHLVDVGLAYLLKDICYAAWHSEPVRAVAASAVLETLAANGADPEIHALAAWTHGIAAMVDGQMEQAITLLDDAAARFTALDMPRPSASTQVGKLLALAMLSRYDEAIATGVHVRDIFVSLGDALEAGKVEVNLGNIYDRRDRYAEAAHFFRLARQRLLKIDAQRPLVSANTGLANVLSQQHQFHAAVQLYEEALAGAESTGLEEMQAVIEGNLGSLALDQGRYDQALSYLERSRRRYTMLGRPHEAWLAERELADAYLELNLIPEATAIYEQVVPLFAELKMPFEQAWTLAQYGRASLLNKQFDRARDLLHEARRLFAVEENAVCEAMVVLLDAQRLHTIGDYPGASAAAAWAEGQFSASGPSVWLVYACWLHGDALRLQQDYAAAQTILTAALKAAQRYAVPQFAQRCYTSLGLLTSVLHGPNAAASLFEQAIDLIEDLRAPLPAEEFRTAFFADKLVPYSELVRICLADASSQQVIRALEYVERARSRALTDMLGGALPALPQPRDAFEAEMLSRLADLRSELNWFYNQINRTFASDAHPDASTIETLQAAVRERETAILEIKRQVRQHGATDKPDTEYASSLARLDLARLQRDLAPDTTLVEYFTLDDELLAFVVTHAEVRVFRNLGQMATIKAAVNQVRFQVDALHHGRERLSNRMEQLTRRVQHYLGQLYEALIAPLEAAFTGTRLVIVPHQSLHYVPFPALYDRSHSRYLIEQYELCSAPSASILQYCLHQPTRPLRQALLVGAADERAPQVRNEVISLAGLFPEAVTLVDAQATTTALRAHAPSADVVHLACHGQFRPDNPLFSSLRLNGSWFTVQDAYQLALRQCQIVTLSACETGVNAVAPGDELIGLARGFFSAGAPSIVVSLWTVDDSTTAALMTHFYTRLCAGERPAAALRSAQRSLLQAYPHPFFWSPFVLLGRW